MVGGGARSSFWVQLAANVFGQPVCTTTAEDASYGMALLAAVGAGALTLRDAAQRIQIVQTFEPREPIATFYDKLYREVYCGHYDKSQRELDAAMKAALESNEYREAVKCWEGLG